MQHLIILSDLLKFTFSTFDSFLRPPDLHLSKSKSVCLSLPITIAFFPLYGTNFANVYGLILSLPLSYWVWISLNSHLFTFSVNNLSESFYTAAS